VKEKIDESTDIKKTRSFSIHIGHKKVEEGKRQGQVFGIALGDILAKEGGKIPKLVEDCVEFIKKRGMETDGLFRASPNHETLSQFVKMLDEGGSINFEQMNDVHIVCGILKKLLRDQPPVLTPENYTIFIAINNLLKKK